MNDDVRELILEAAGDPELTDGAFRAVVSMLLTERRPLTIAEIAYGKRLDEKRNGK